MSYTKQPASQEVVATGMLTFKEFRKYNEIHSENYMKWASLIAFLAFSLIIGIPADNEEGLFMALLVVVIVALPGTLLIYFILRLAIYIRAKQEFKSNPGLYKDLTYHFSPEGIRLEQGRSVVYHEWSQILSVRETPAMFILFISKNRAIVAPKRFFSSEEDIRQFQKLLGRYIDRWKIKIK